MNEKEIEALVKIEFFSRNHGYKLGLAEEKIGVPHYVLDGLNKQKLIFARTKFGKMYWSLTKEGKPVAGKASRDQLTIDTTTLISACKTCIDLGIIATPELVEKAKKMRKAVGMIGCNEIEIHLLTKHQEIVV